MKRILLLPYLRIQNANALSSPYTIGFPAMTSWLGAVHALQRQLNQQGFTDLVFKGVSVVSHEFKLNTFKGHSDYVYSIIGTGNPLDKNGERSAFIEEARCHLTVSIVIEYSGLDKDDEDKFINILYAQMHRSMKFSGGDFLGFKKPFEKPEILKIGEDKDYRKLVRKLMPGFVLVERRDLMIDAMKNGQDAIDAMLEYLKIMHRSEQNDQGKVTWTSGRKTSGWIVPIATGFHGISPLGQAQNQRAPDIPHRFAESVVTLGEFKMLYRIKNIDDMLWHSCFDIENNLYLCQHNT
ncbi:CRISPR-associated protein Csy2 [Legionella nautarum]|uniref:CRISPR-associated protein Csy2 n=2 Tax=Legionella TaxID=445 RepID=A0A0W0WLP8_9GAMM|nr:MULTISPECIES: type I-F CRISPR-associated protein Csy2 [Legionella]KTC89129.1 CRISPR-associated protein Csy2 [Legionella drozanskii LLAP-1]KTD33030.1 CRISPR-associated protein Csy2 [Legionella nautarum]